MQEKFAETVAGQSDLLDQLSRQLITLELAIPGLYATVLKLIGGANATLKLNGVFYASLISWLIALILTLTSLFPRKWKVDPEILRQDPAQKSRVLGTEDFFRKSALYKRALLIPACLLFFAGIICTIFTTT